MRIVIADVKGFILQEGPAAGITHNKAAQQMSM